MERDMPELSKEDKIRKRHSDAIRVYCSEEEKKIIEQKAKDCGYTTSNFLRLIGQGEKVTGILDHVEMLKLLKIDGHNRRLGALLKIWLRVKHFDKEYIDYILDRVKDINKAVIATSQAVLSYKGRRKNRKYFFKMKRG